MIDVIENYIHLEKRLPNDDSTKNDSLDYYPTFCGGAAPLERVHCYHWNLLRNL